ncbi:MAG: SGNH/GDSL hydrolase family protein, partial [Bacteroidia bacterium]|nr:SGNH/GDSL hydrolase family protein [Bacteroidia bacterium]
IKYLALGDSYTIGQGVGEQERWPNQLGDRLAEEGFEIGSIDIIAQTGWTTSNLLSAVANNALDDYNLVSLLIGVNNQFQGKDFNVFKTEFEELINISIQASGDTMRVFVVSIPDYGVTPFGASKKDQIAMELDTYNAFMKAFCQDKDIPFVDVTAISRELGDSDVALASDRLHPSGFQYKAWVEEIFPVVLKLFN